MQKSRLFQVCSIWNPTEKQVKDEGLKAKLITDIETVLSQDEQTVRMKAAMSIPDEYRDQLEQIDIVVRPF